MKNYVFIYYGMDGGMDAWQAWFKSLGDKVVDMGNPFGGGKAIMKSGVSEVRDPAATGYSIIKAASLDEAVELGKDCPSAESDDGAVCVYETMPM